MRRDKTPYRLLIVEDNPGDFILVEQFLLDQIDSPVLAHAKNFARARELLASPGICFDAILLDLSLPDKTGVSLIREMIELCPNIPVIVLTGYTDFAFGINSLALGISDYILKEELTAISLYKSIVYSLERKKSMSVMENYIKAIEFQNERFREISWQQSHVIRAPLARMMGLIDLIKHPNSVDEDKQTAMDYLIAAGNELDKVIKHITELSEK